MRYTLVITRLVIKYQLQPILKQATNESVVYQPCSPTILSSALVVRSYYWVRHPDRGPGTTLNISLVEDYSRSYQRSCVRSCGTNTVEQGCWSEFSMHKFGSCRVIRPLIAAADHPLYSAFTQLFLLGRTVP